MNQIFRRVFFSSAVLRNNHFRISTSLLIDSSFSKKHGFVALTRTNNDIIGKMISIQCKFLVKFAFSVCVTGAYSPFSS